MTSTIATPLAPALRNATTAVSVRQVELALGGGAALAPLPLVRLLRAGLGFERAEPLVGSLAFRAAWVISDPRFALTCLLFHAKLGERVLGWIGSPAQLVRCRAPEWLLDRHRPQGSARPRSSSAAGARAPS